VGERSRAGIMESGVGPKLTRTDRFWFLRVPFMADAGPDWVSPLWLLCSMMRSGSLMTDRSFFLRRNEAQSQAFVNELELRVFDVITQSVGFRNSALRIAST
jgi:hypothetical protein